MLSVIVFFFLFSSDFFWIVLRNNTRTSGLLRPVFRIQGSNFFPKEVRDADFLVYGEFLYVLVEIKSLVLSNYCELFKKFEHLMVPDMFSSYE